MVSLAAFNLLPLPALDAERLLIIFINSILGKRNKELKGTVISVVTMLALLVLGVLIAFKDIQTLRQSTTVLASIITSQFGRIFYMAK